VNYGEYPVTTELASTALPLYSSFATDPDMAELIEMFVADMSLHVAAMEIAVRDGDWKSLERMAHRLKGSAGGYGFSTIGTAAGALELAISYSDRDTITKRADRLLFHCRRVRN
jgi:HPt (histidine-containing phosphotransfer) domain-containing protein